MARAVQPSVAWELAFYYDLRTAGTMHPDLLESLASRGVDAARFPHLAAGYEESQLQLADLSAALHAAVPLGTEPAPLDIVVFGSIARREATTKSDLDYLLIAHGLPSSPRLSRELLKATDEFLAANGIPRPGGTGMFGTIVSAPDLVERIGLEHDTNMSHSRRVLLLEESESVYQPELLADLKTKTVHRYLIDYEDHPKAGPPRFLINDLVRYWSTLAVDYQAKRWENEGRYSADGWGLRYLKFLISRRITYAASLVSLLTCAAADRDIITEQFELPALARLGRLLRHEEFTATEQLVEVLAIADRFVASLGDESFRDAAKQVTSKDELDADGKLLSAREDADRLHGLLKSLFFEERPLSRTSLHYLTF